MKQLCEYCGLPFERKNNSQKFCSIKCRNKKRYSKLTKEDKAKIKEKLYQRNLEKNKGERIQCKICGKWFRQVGSHVVQTHKMTAREYRKKFGFDVKKGQLPEDIKKLKASKAIENDTYKNLRKGKKYWFKKGDKKAGKYERSEQTLERIKNIERTKQNKRKTCKTCGKELKHPKRIFCSKDCLKKFNKKEKRSKISLF